MEKDYTMYCGKYFGLNKIKFVTDLEWLQLEKTYKGKEMIRLTFENDEIFDIPVEVAQYAITEKSIDLTSLREILVKPVVKEIVEILLERQLKIEDFEYVFSKVRGSIQESIVKATNNLWKKDANLLTLVDVDKALTQKNYGKRTRTTKDSNKTI